MLMILARLVRSESFWAVAKVRSPHTGPGISYINHQNMGGSAQPGRDVPQSACAYYSHAIRYIHRHRIERLLPHALESSPYVRLQSCRFQCDDKWPPL